MKFLPLAVIRTIHKNHITWTNNLKKLTFLLEGDKDILFPFEKSIENAKRQIKKLKDVKVFNNVGHGIETHDNAMNYIGEQIKNYH